MQFPYDGSGPSPQRVRGQFNSLVGVLRMSLSELGKTPAAESLSQELRALELSWNAELNEYQRLLDPHRGAGSTPAE